MFQYTIRDATSINKKCEILALGRIITIKQIRIHSNERRFFLFLSSAHESRMTVIIFFSASGAITVKYKKM